VAANQDNPNPLEKLKHLADGLEKYTPLLRSTARLAILASRIPGLRALRAIGHIERAAYLGLMAHKAIKTLRGAGKGPSGGGPSSTGIQTVAPRGSAPAVQRAPASLPWYPKALPPAPKGLPAPTAPNSARSSQHPMARQPAPAAPSPLLSDAERKQLKKDFGEQGAADIERGMQDQASQKPTVHRLGPTAKSIPMPSAERRTGDRAPRLEKMRRAPERERGPKRWTGHESQERDRSGRWTGFEKAGWGKGDGKAQSEGGDDATEDRQEMLETVQELRDLSKEILTALKQSPGSPSRKQGSSGEGGEEGGEETAPGNGSMGNAIKTAGNAGKMALEVAGDATEGAETAGGMGSLLELIACAL
jgi:hypothetical protein